MIPDGLTISVSRYGAKETMDRLATAVTNHGMSILARIDHAAAAAKVGMDLRPTEVLIFGNPRAGTPLMQAAQTMGIDLPLRALVWQDETGRVCLAYNDPKWLAERHGAGSKADRSLDAIVGALAAVANEAII
jgi:uncharacterized protein (DUF302 family)